MNTTEKQPVAEQPSEDKTLEVSDNSATESPATFTDTAENNFEEKVNIDYLGSSLFNEIKEITPEDLTPDVAFDYDVITTPRADLEIRVMNAPPAYEFDKLRVRLLKTFEEYSTCDADWRVFNGANIDSTWACMMPGDVWMPYLSIDQTDPENEVNTIDSIFCESFETTTINVVY